MPNDQVFCPYCGTASTANVNFCAKCGKPLPKILPSSPNATPPAVPISHVPPLPVSPVPQLIQSDFITLSCPNCGGNLRITNDIERFACQFCGYEHIVRRSGGVVSLEPVVKAMGQISENINLVGVGVNKLGFSSEKQVAEQTIARLKGEMAQINKELGEYENSSGVGAGIGSFMGIGAFVLLILAFINGWSFWLILLFLGLVGFSIWGVVSSTKDNPMQKKLKGELAEKQAELERNYEIVRRV